MFCCKIYLVLSSVISGEDSSGSIIYLIISSSYYCIGGMCGA